VRPGTVQKASLAQRGAPEWDTEKSRYAALLFALDNPSRRFDAQAVHLLFCRIMHPLIRSW